MARRKMRMPKLGDIVNLRKEDDDEFDEEYDGDDDAGYYDEDDDYEDEPVTAPRKEAAAGRVGKGMFGRIGMPKRKSGDDFILPSVEAALNDKEEPEVTAEQCRNVKFNVSKPHGYFFPQVEAYAGSVTRTIEWYEDRLFKAKTALYELVNEHDAQVVAVQDLRMQIEAFKVQGQAVTNPDGSYFTESQQRAAEELDRLREAVQDSERTQASLRAEISALQAAGAGAGTGGGDEALRAELEDLRASYSALEETNKGWEERDASLSSYVAELEASASELKEDKAALVAKVEEWEAYAASLEAEREQILQSEDAEKNDDLQIDPSQDSLDESIDVTVDGGYDTAVDEDTTEKMLTAEEMLDSLIEQEADTVDEAAATDVETATDDSAVEDSVDDEVSAEDNPGKVEAVEDTVVADEAVEDEATEPAVKAKDVGPYEPLMAADFDDDKNVGFTYANDEQGAPLSRSWNPDEEAEWANMFAPKTHPDDE